MNLASLLKKCDALAGISFGQLASQLKLQLPTPSAKGWLGQAIEIYLGSSAGNKAIPDFPNLGIELKTLPIGVNNKPTESTFICSISLTTQETWESSRCYNKLRSILWIPVEGLTTIPYMQRRIGHGFLWQPSKDDLVILKADWQYFSDKIAFGEIADISSHQGRYLQIRPKAANAKALCNSYNQEGNKVKTLPRGFYLRSSFSHKIYIANT